MPYAIIICPCVLSVGLSTFRVLQDMTKEKLWSSLLCNFLHSRTTVEAMCFFFYYYLVCEASGSAATPGLLCQPRAIVKMIVEKQMECRMAGKTEVLGENLPQRHFCPSQNPTWSDPGLNPVRRGGKCASYHLVLKQLYDATSTFTPKGSKRLNNTFMYFNC
jgi:hypothetical protein